MQSDSYNESYRKIEAAAARIEAILDDLVRQIESYQKVSQNLNDASGHLKEATTQYRDVSAEVREVAKAMRQVGMPHLLEAQARTQEEFKAGLSQVKSELRGVASSLSGSIDTQTRTLRLVILGGFTVLAGLAVASIAIALAR